MPFKPIDKSVTQQPWMKLANKDQAGNEWYQDTRDSAFIPHSGAYYYFKAGSNEGWAGSSAFDVPESYTKSQAGANQKPSWIDGTSSQGQATENRRAPIIPLPGAILVQEDDASADTKRPLGGNGGSTRPVVDRTTGQVRREPDDEELRRGALLLR